MASALAPLNDIAYREATRRITEQQAVLASLQTRAGTVLAAASIATSFLGGAALRGGADTMWTWIGVAFFLIAAALVIAVLWPRRGWEFSIGARALLSGYADATVDELHRELAQHLESSHDRNSERLHRLVLCLEGACVALAVEVLAWIIDLATR